MNKTYFCSDTHFSHTNIIKYEPQRIEETILYMLEMGLEGNFLEDLDEILKKYNYISSYTNSYQASVVSQMIEADDFLSLVIKDIMNDSNFYSENEEEYKLNKEFQKEELKVILNYHNKMLINRWNNVVDKNDVVYFLGDFAFKDRKDAEIIGRQLNGHKIIILGNHDGIKYNQDKSVKYDSILASHFKACGFERVEFNPILLKGKFLLSHTPLQYNKESNYINLYGHVHSSKEFDTIDKFKTSICVCLDRTNYEPIELEEYNNYRGE